MKGCILETNLEGQWWQIRLFTILLVILGVEIFLKKREHQKEGALK